MVVNSALLCWSVFDDYEHAQQKKTQISVLYANMNSYRTTEHPKSSLMKQKYQEAKV
jgi:hypothetical protein